MTKQSDVVVVGTPLFVPSNMFNVYGPSNSETLVSKLSPSFTVVNTTLDAVHVQFPTRKLIFTIVREGSINSAELWVSRSRLKTYGQFY